VIVQHPQRAVGDRWRGCVPRLLQSATPYRQALRPASHSASASVQMSNWLSLRFRDASVGIISLALIVFAVMLFPLSQKGSIHLSECAQCLPLLAGNAVQYTGATTTKLAPSVSGAPPTAEDIAADAYSTSLLTPQVQSLRLPGRLPPLVGLE
jgi:hypothetical protein